LKCAGGVAFTATQRHGSVSGLPTADLPIHPELERVSAAHRDSRRSAFGDLIHKRDLIQRKEHRPADAVIQAQEPH